MNNKIIFLAFTAFLALVGCWGYVTTFNKADSSSSSHSKRQKSEKMKIGMILGSTRQGRSSAKIGRRLKNVAIPNEHVEIEIINLRDYNLPFLDDETPPASRKTISDPAVQRWSDKIKEVDAFIIVVPEYNAGYPGVLKNALDSLYQEWNGKPVALIGYSGGSSGGTSAVAQLQQVLARLKMEVIEPAIVIPQVWKAFDAQDDFVDASIKPQFLALIDKILDGVNKNNRQITN